MIIDLELQIASDNKTLPHPSQFREWISMALIDKLNADTTLTIRVVDKSEMSDLNKKYRNKKGPTNVLAFANTELDYAYLGDIIVCAPIIEQEAQKSKVDLLAHWAHIVIHGALHLIGYDHEKPKDAKVMEKLETELLVKLGFPPPYGKQQMHK